MNRVALVGRLTRDPELRFVQGSGTAVTTVTIAVDDYDNKTKQKTAQFFPVVVWGKQAENLAQFMTKGGLISVNGKLRSRSYDAQDGTKRYVTEVVADMRDGIKFLSKPTNSGQSSNNQNYNHGNNHQNYNGGNQGYYNQGYNNQGYGNQGYNQNPAQNNNMSSSIPDNAFNDAFGGFGGDITPVDDGDMPF